LGEANEKFESLRCFVLDRLALKLVRR
jgi:hypothetical protein